MSSYDAIVIPGGGVRAGGELPVWTTRRLDRALAIGGFDYIITLSAGTTHKPPPLDGSGYPIYESVAAAHYLIDHSVSPRQILAETSSYDTIGNAFFGRVIHVDPLGLRKLLIITSAFHMPRTRAIFEWVYGLDRPEPGYELEFEAVADEGIDPRILEARREKERTGLARLAETTANIRSLAELHRWLFSEHAAYAAGRATAHPLAEDVLDTY